MPTENANRKIYFLDEITLTALRAQAEAAGTTYKLPKEVLDLLNIPQ